MITYYLGWMLCANSTWETLVTSQTRYRRSSSSYLSETISEYKRGSILPNVWWPVRKSNHWATEVQMGSSGNICARWSGGCCSFYACVSEVAVLIWAWLKPTCHLRYHLTLRYSVYMQGFIYTIQMSYTFVRSRVCYVLSKPRFLLSTLPLNYQYVRKTPVS